MFLSKISEQFRDLVTTYYTEKLNNFEIMINLNLRKDLLLRN